MVVAVAWTNRELKHIVVCGSKNWFCSEPFFKSFYVDIGKAIGYSQGIMILKLLSCAGTLACLLVFSSSGVRGELENWEDYPVILTVDYDKAIFLTPETGCYIVEDR